MARIPTDGVKDERHGSVSRSNSVNSSRRPSATGTPHDHPALRLSTNSRTQSPIIKSSNSTPHTPIEQREEVIAAEIVVKMETGKAPKLSRTASQKVLSRSPALFLDELDRYDEATSAFQVIDGCIYANKNLGITEPALECDCAEEWDAATKENMACGEDSDCINRATKMECADDCGCGSACQNQRFQRKQWAKVTVFKTEKKGYGLRADTDLRPGDFIFEYVGEVINEPHFRRRMRVYDDEGIKHFYFMSLTKGEFVDATKKGNLGRFCNHSCNPNCYVDKWVIGERLRMGIFAERHIKKGEELVFNYNVDRYGADPQPCYCGEPNCTGYIGGKTQTEAATKLSNATIEALGIDDYDDWEFAVAKKPRKARKTGENDEEYVNDVEPKSLEEDGVTKVMAALMQCKEKWIAVKLLGRIQRAEDEKVTNRVVRMHGYRILKTALSNFLEDTNVCLQVLDILSHLPRITRNKIQDSKIEEVVEKLKESEDERVMKQATEILEIWNKLEVGYRIPRMKRDPNATVRNERPERRDPRERSRSRSRSKTPAAPSGPKSSIPQRNPGFFSGPRQPFRRPPFNPLPAGWFTATANGRLYYYSASGQTTWTRPFAPASQPPPPPKELTHEEKLQQIINNVTKNNTPKDRSPAVSTPQAGPELKKAKKEEKWRSLSEDKQKKLYENTLYPHIKYVIDKYKHKLPRDDIKRFAKEVSKKLAGSDFKNGRVSDPSQISSKHAKSVKKFTKEYFDKAVIKHREHEQRVRERAAKEDAARGIKSTTPVGDPPTMGDAMDIDDEVKLTDDEISDDEGAAEPERAGSTESAMQKRKRDSDEGESNASPTESSKKFRGDVDAPSPPPPPPPPPADSPNVENGEENYDMMVAGSDENAGMELNGHLEQMEMVQDGNGHTAPELASGVNGPS